MENEFGLDDEVLNIADNVTKRGNTGTVLKAGDIVTCMVLHEEAPYTIARENIKKEFNKDVENARNMGLPRPEFPVLNAKTYGLGYKCIILEIMAENGRESNEMILTEHEGRVVLPSYPVTFNIHQLPPFELLSNCFEKDNGYLFYPGDKERWIFNNQMINNRFIIDTLFENACPTYIIENDKRYYAKDWPESMKAANPDKVDIENKRAASWVERGKIWHSWDEEKTIKLMNLFIAKRYGLGSVESTTGKIVWYKPKKGLIFKARIDYIGKNNYPDVSVIYNFGRDHVADFMVENPEDKDIEFADKVIKAIIDNVNKREAEQGIA